MNGINKLLMIMVLGSSTLICLADTVLNSSWSDVARGRCSDQNATWWGSAEAIRIAENVLLYQRQIGGWPKNTDMHLVLTEGQKSALIAAKPNNSECTIDNGAVYYELTYLSRVYSAISDETVKNQIKEGFVLGIQYLIEAQYDNGGWPQFYPLRGGYSNHITYNDDAMVRVMEILRHVYLKDSEYSIKVDDNLANEAQLAFEKGLECILKTQYVQNGKLTVWCAQHHFSTLEPAQARSYELASLSGQESAGVAELLMSIPDPSDEVVRAVYSAASWYDENRIKGQRLENFVNGDGLNDKRVVLDPNAPDMWARFYTLEDNIPFFCDRDGIMKFALADIGHERRNGYSWYGNSGFDVINRYNSWLTTKGRTALASPVPDHTFLGADTIPVRAYANKYTGKNFIRFELIIDTTTVVNYTGQVLDTLITGLSLGEHSFVVRAVYEGDYFETDSSYIMVSLPTYSLLVEGGTGSGNYTAGSSVTIQANDPPEGKVFDKWIGDTDLIEDPTDPETMLMMPEGDVQITATYKEIALGAKDLARATAICYPNPVWDQLTIDLTEMGTAQIELVDLQGRKVHSENRDRGIHMLNLDFLSAGQYVVLITNETKKAFTYKIFKRE